MKLSYCFYSKKEESKDKKVLVDHNKPLIIPFGLDSLEMIGSPLLPAGDINQVTARFADSIHSFLTLSCFDGEKWKQTSLIFHNKLVFMFLL